jgi:hypothetical protein
LAFFNFFLYSVDRGTAAPPGHVWLGWTGGLSSRKVFCVYPINLPSKQTGLAPLSRAIAVLSVFMGNFVFLIFIMAQPDGQILST